MRIIPIFLELSQELSRLTYKDTIKTINEMINISKLLYNDSSIERIKSLHSIIDIVAIYCPNDTNILNSLSSSIMYNCQKNRILKNITHKSDKITLFKLETHGN